MNGTELWGYIAGGIGVMMGLAGWIRNGKGDAATQSAWMGMVNAKLDQIAGDLQKLNGVLERVAVLERDVKTAFMRIDENRVRLEKQLEMVLTGGVEKCT